MPSTYAHYIFGQQIRGRLSGYERKVIDKYPELFNIGLHGPDILFYYRPLGKNKVNQLGSRLCRCRSIRNRNPELHEDTESKIDVKSIM